METKGINLDNARDILKEMQQGINEVNTEKTERLAKSFYKVGKRKLARTIRKKGLPVDIMCSEKVYNAVFDHLKYYATGEILKNNYMPEDMILFFWESQKEKYPPALTLSQEADKLHKEFMNTRPLWWHAHPNPLTN